MAEGKKEKELFDKFMCWCTTGRGDLEKSIGDAETKISELGSDIKEATAALAQMKSDLAGAQSGKSEAISTLKKATALRAKEAGEYAKASSDYNTNIAAMKKAIAAIEKGATGFLQTSTASVLRRLTITLDLTPTDRDVLTSFLSQGQGQELGYAPQSGEITGILKQMLDTMEKDLSDTTAAEDAAKANFEEQSAALTKEIKALTNKIETLLVRIGDAGVELVNMKEDLDDTSKCLMEDQGFLAELQKSCSTKQADYEERSKTRAEELLALADTIKILNDDDSLELFKKTLPTPALLQQTVSSRTVRHQALKVLQRALGGQKDFRLKLIETALKGKGTFDKVIKLIDDMVTLLGKEQVDDDNKKEYCENLIDKTEDEMKELDHTVADLEQAIEERKGQIATLTDEIAALTKGIAELDKAVAEATDTRKEEHEDYVETMAADNAAKDIIGIAKNRMQKFYNPKLYVAPAKRELSEEERITLNMGGTLAPTVDPNMGTIAGTGVTALAQKEAPPPPPETFGAYAKKSEASGGVMSMMDMLVADLDKEMQTMQVDEKNAQEEYEDFMKDSAAKRADDSKSIAEKENAKAAAEAEVLSMGEEHTTTVNEAMSKGEYLKDLHADCDWLVQNFETRKAARAGEVDALKKAKAVLSGADYSLVQTSTQKRLRARR